jgi:hypothetical protein
MAKCQFCGRNEARKVHIPSSLMHDMLSRSLDVCVCERCMSERACPGFCGFGYFSLIRGPGRIDRMPCPVCGGGGTFDYSQIRAGRAR